jgi:hypothetical protein
VQINILAHAHKTLQYGQGEVMWLSFFVVLVSVSFIIVYGTFYAYHDFRLALRQI